MSLYETLLSIYQGSKPNSIALFIDSLIRKDYDACHKLVTQFGLSLDVQTLFGNFVISDQYSLNIQREFYQRFSRFTINEKRYTTKDSRVTSVVETRHGCIPNDAHPTAQNGKNKMTYAQLERMTKENEDKERERVASHTANMKNDAKSLQEARDRVLAERWSVTIKASSIQVPPFQKRADELVDEDEHSTLVEYSGDSEDIAEEDHNNPLSLPHGPFFLRGQVYQTKDDIDNAYRSSMIGNNNNEKYKENDVIILMCKDVDHFYARIAVAKGELYSGNPLTIWSSWKYDSRRAFINKVTFVGSSLSFSERDVMKHHPNSSYPPEPIYIRQRICNSYRPYIAQLFGYHVKPTGKENEYFTQIKTRGH